MIWQYCTLLVCEWQASPLLSVPQSFYLYGLRFSIRLRRTAAEVNRATTIRRRSRKPIPFATWVATAISINPKVTSMTTTSEAMARATRCLLVSEDAAAGTERCSSVPGMSRASGYGLPELLNRLRCFTSRLTSLCCKRALRCLTGSREGDTRECFGTVSSRFCDS